MQSVVLRNNRLWAAHTVWPLDNGPDRTAVQWWKLSTSGGVLEHGRIDDSSGNEFYAYPSITVNKDNGILIGFALFSRFYYASAACSFRAATDPASAFLDLRVFKDGEAPYYKTFGGDENRWGDYSNTVVDPLNDTDTASVGCFVRQLRGTPAAEARSGIVTTLGEEAQLYYGGAP